MKAKHHLWTSVAAGGVLYFATGSPSAFAGMMVGGFLIDSDHAVDQFWSWSAETRQPGSPSIKEDGGVLRGFLRRRKLMRLYLVFHSYELLVSVALLAAIFQAPFLVGLALGYALHIGLDLVKHQHEFRSPLFYLILYRRAHGFRRDRLIKAEYQ